MELELVGGVTGLGWWAGSVDRAVGGVGDGFPEPQGPGHGLFRSPWGGSRGFEWRGMCFHLGYRKLARAAVAGRGLGGQEWADGEPLGPRAQVAPGAGV